MYKNAIGICLSFIAAGGLILPFAGAENALFFLIYGAVSAFAIIILVALRIFARKNGFFSPYDSYFWLFNEKRSGGLTVFLSAANALLVLSFVSLIFIARDRIDTDSFFIAVIVFAFQIIDLIKTARSGSRGEKKRKRGRKEEMSEFELTALNKSAGTFLTAGILPLAACFFFGEFWYKIIAPPAIFVLTHLVSYIYSAFWKRKHRGIWEWRG